MLAEAPIRDGAVQLHESHVAWADPDDSATASRYAAVRAALLKRFGEGFASDRDREIERANTFAQNGQLEPPVIPDDEVTTLSLYRDRPTPLG